MIGPNVIRVLFGGCGFIWMIFIFIFIVAIIIGMIMLTIWLVRRVGYPFESMSNFDKALEVLKKRYAKGEIRKKEYEDIKREINEPLLRYKNYLKY
ncbi:MAG: SHOCT domain-containing protein [Actinobacteria bacterium]|nr:SHOCT domain-containing protein [Actinomycetota bacterium]